MISARPIATAAAAALAVVATALAVPALAGAEPARYRAYYERFSHGPALLPGHDTSLVPQGLTYWVKRDALIVSYYDSDGGPSRLAIVDRAGGRYIKTLLLRTTGHVGGLGMTLSGYLFVASDGKLFRYRPAPWTGAPRARRSTPTPASASRPRRSSTCAGTTSGWASSPPRGARARTRTASTASASPSPRAP
jgi:hypothetical protein